MLYRLTLNYKNCNTISMAYFFFYCFEGLHYVWRFYKLLWAKTLRCFFFFCSCFLHWRTVTGRVFVICLGWMWRISATCLAKLHHLSKEGTQNWEEQLVQEWGCHLPYDSLLPVKSTFKKKYMTLVLLTKFYLVR